MTSKLNTLIGRVGGVVVMLMALTPAVLATAPAAQAATPSPARVAQYEARVAHLINVTRAANHRVGVATAGCPVTYANRWAPYLARTGYFYHQSMYPILATCRASVAAENIARGDVSADAIYIAWMRSPGHRANILDGRLNRIGVSAVYDHGTWTVVADFTRN
jgi:uncharacterized protein YkwD